MESAAAPAPVEAPKEFSQNSVRLTLTTDEAIERMLTPREMSAVEEFYIETAENDVEFRKVFIEPKWELPGWSSPLSSVEAYFARAIVIYCGVLMKEPQGLKPMHLVNEERAVLLGAQLAARHDFPFYVVGRKILTAAQKTKPFQQWDFNHFPLPFPCTTFLLPKGSKFAGETMTHFIVLRTTFNGVEKVVFIGANRTLPVFIGTHSIGDDGILDVEAAAGMKKTDYLEAVKNNKVGYSSSPDRIEEVSLNIMQLCLNLVGIMHARKDMVEEGGTIRVVGKRKIEIKRPRMLGQHYTYKTEYRPKSDAENGRTYDGEPYWRAAHWHTVSHGPKWSLKRMEWFEPILVGVKPS